MIAKDSGSGRWVEQAAVDVFRASPDRAFSGRKLISVETSEEGSSQAIADIASDDPVRFAVLISALSPIIQDILLQYYLLGRTHDEIGFVLFPNKAKKNRDRSKNPAELAARRGHEIGIAALCAVMQGGTHDGMLKFEARTRRKKEVRVSSSSDLGQFVIKPNGQLPELFAPRQRIRN